NKPGSPDVPPGPASCPRMRSISLAHLGRPCIRAAVSCSGQTSKGGLMSSVIDGALVLAASGEHGAAEGTGAEPETATGTPGWWRSWRSRFGLAEVCGTLAAVAGFAAGFWPDRSLLAAAG